MNIYYLPFICVCYNKTRYPQLSDGQTGYASSKLDTIVEEIIHDLFGKVKSIPRMEVIDKQYKNNLNLIQARLTKAKCTLEKHFKDLSDYKFLLHSRNNLI
jgi:hypothetical protein